MAVTGGGQGDRVVAFGRDDRGFESSHHRYHMRSTLDRNSKEHRVRPQQNHTRFQVRSKFYSNMAVPLWNKLPKLVATCSNAEEFKEILVSGWLTVHPELQLIASFKRICKFNLLVTIS